MTQWGLFVLFVAAALQLRAHGQRWPAAIVTLAMLTVLSAVVVVVLSVLGA
jgi:hypothetical protein